MKVLVSDDPSRPAEQKRVVEGSPWRVVAVISLVFMVVGFVDSALTFFPTAFGTTEWEFGTVTASLNGLPLPVLSLALFAAAGVELGWIKLTRVACVLMILVALVIAAMALLYLTTLPQALNAAQQAGPMGQLGIKKSIMKSAVQLIAYPVGLCLTARVAWIMARRGS